MFSYVSRIDGQRRLPWLFALGCLLTAGCAVSMATKQPDKRDVSVLRPLVSRSQVIAELGQPVLSEHRDGRRVEVFAFKQGYSKATKTTRAFAHGVADFLTLGLWEVIGTPTETYFSGTDVKVEITYDEQDCVDQVTVLEGEDIVRPKPIFAGLGQKRS